jgi:hypothetical protein
MTHHGTRQVAVMLVIKPKSRIASLMRCCCCVRQLTHADIKSYSGYTDIQNIHGAYPDRFSIKHDINMGMDQYLLIPFLVE